MKSIVEVVAVAVGDCEQSLADQQVKDGQFESARERRFALGNEKRISVVEGSPTTQYAEGRLFPATASLL
jgi:hypothetical protein